MTAPAQVVAHSGLHDWTRALPCVTEDQAFALVEQIVTQLRPARITAFGSRARGTHRPESDLDLGVMFDSEADLARRPRLERTGAALKLSADILSFTRARHEFMRDSVVSVHHDIAREGVLLYDAGVGSIDLRAIARIAR